MSNEMAFKSIKITLSREALDRLEAIVKDASFRSYSSGVEECIRGLSDVLTEIGTVIGKGEGRVSTTVEERAIAFSRIAMRLSRFTGRTIIK